MDSESKMNIKEDMGCLLAQGSQMKKEKRLAKVDAPDGVNAAGKLEQK